MINYNTSIIVKQSQFFMNLNITKEVCVDSYYTAFNAEKLGADRLELCSNLELDGLTPSKKLIEKSIKNISIPLKIMIRPRKGNFIYNQNEIDQMIIDIDFCQNLGINEIVFGALNSKKQADINILKKITKKFPEINITFHKAIDLTNDIFTEINKLTSIPQIKSILTSGGSSNAISGSDNIKKIISLFNDRLTIIAAGRITKKNLPQIHSLINGTDYHGKKIVGNLN